MKYIPTVYSGKYLVKFYKETVFGEISNHDHEQEIKNVGDTVEIRSLPDITIRTYTKGMSLTYEQPTATPTTLYINKGKYWGFSTNEVDDVQTDLKDYMDQWMDVAMKQMKEAVDLDVLGNIYADVSSYNKGATAGLLTSGVNLGVDGSSGVALTKNDVIDKVCECGQVLTEQDVPKAGRWMVIPAWMRTIISMSDAKDASMMGDAKSELRGNGRLGNLAGFTFYESNQLSTATDGTRTCTRVLFGTNDATTFAAQITKNEHIVNPNDFGIYHRGLMVYGYKVVKPTAMGVLYCYKGT